MGGRARKSLVLLVEDDPEEAELAARALKEAGAKVVSARDGEEALAFLLKLAAGGPPGPEGRPDLVLLDIRLPRLDGAEVLRRLRASEKLRRIPVVIFTSSSAEQDVAQCYDAGANGFVVKPVDWHEYSRAVAELADFWLRLNRTPDSW